MTLPFDGTFTALVTPFRNDADKSLDVAAYEALLEAQVAGGVEGVVPVGTTGESPTLDEAEQRSLFERAVAVARGRAKVIAGCGSNSTKHAVHAVRAAEKAGVDAVMVVVPYYNKPTQEGLFAHFSEVAKATALPVVVYNVPGRTMADISAETLARLAEACPNVLATKEATGNVLRAQELSRALGNRIAVLSGDDALTLPMISVGARGVISVTSNVYPREVSDATRAALSGDFAAARKLHFPLLPVHEAMFLEANPAPAKAALAWKKQIQDVLRSPMVPMSEAARKRLFPVLETFERGVSR